uniref:Uncharacterized protein n=1 Tax=Gossypium raimondii TaxID=29730 RepID=A0A0D2VDX6_GOSRA|nr:hypothetical protein B456_013G117900 [Gossypium raimondii]
MAEVFGKGNLFTTCNYSQTKNLEGGTCLVPKKISGFSLERNCFSSLKVKSQALRSGFNGQRMVFLEKKSMNRRRFCQVPIKAQMQSGLIGRFLQVNYEEHKSMCYSLNVHVLPFFRFYRGAQGRVCSFSCTNATIKKFRDALAKHTPDRCSLSTTKGLEEKELLALSANKDLSFNYTPIPTHEEILIWKQAPSDSTRKLPLSVPTTSAKQRDSEEKTLVGVGR